MTRHFKTPAEAALVAGVTQRCVNDWVRRYPGLAIRVGGRWRISPDALARLMRGEPTGIQSAA